MGTSFMYVMLLSDSALLPCREAQLVRERLREMQQTVQELQRMV